ncbi:MAG: DUF6384 family protein [Thiohalocapsa sp.]
MPAHDAVVNEAIPIAAATPPAKPAAKQPLDGVMLAMDVVDTLRRKNRMVERELDVAGRAQDLKERLRKIYAAQGIEVSDAILDEGVAALKEDRFVYKAPPESFSVKLARLYVNRGVWGKWVLGGLAALAIGFAAWQFLVVAPRNALPEDLETLHAEVVELAQQDSADQRAGSLLATARQALRDGDESRARALFTELEQMRNQLEASYSIRVVNRPGERSGVFRIPDVNESARNHYVIVEAIGPDGQNLSVPIRNEETGATEVVSKWGVRVDKRVFDSVAADKQDDGIIQRDIFGRKSKGQLEPNYEVPTTGAGITAW